MIRTNPVAWLAAALLLVACSSTGSSTSPEASSVDAAPKLSGTLEENAVTSTATVKKIDLQQRVVTLEGASGPFTVKAGPEVRNLDQVKVGDEVTATYYESIAYEVHKPGDATPGVESAEEVVRAKPGEAPAAAGARVTTVTATITGIDKENGTFTLTSADGQQNTVKARNPANLDKVKTGDLVEITLSEAVAISVAPKPK